MRTLASVRSLLVLIPVLAGCAAFPKTEVRYTEPAPRELKNERIYNKPAGQVWDELVEKLATSFFQINNISKESRIINVSFSIPTGTEEFVDGGEVQYRLTFRGDERYYTFNRGQHLAQFRHSLPDNTERIIYDVTRTLRVSGRMNIYVAPVAGDENRTKITVNARYVTDGDISILGHLYNQYGNEVLTQAITPAPGWTASSFSTTDIPRAKGTVHEWTYDPYLFDAMYMYVPTGRLEQQVLDLVSD